MTIAFLRTTPLYDKIMKGEYKGGLYNGYVATDKELPLSEQGGAEWDDETSLDNLISVHRGITFDGCIEDFGIFEMIPLTSIPEPDVLKKMRVIGFDTLHLGDTKEDWTYEATKAETLRLLEQIEKL